MSGARETGPSVLEERLQGRLNGAFWVLTGGLLSLLVALLAWFSIDQDHRARAMAQRIAASAVEARLDFLSKTISDYSIWDDAYRNVVEQPDREWMDGNIGPFVFNSLHVERSFVLDDAGKAVYAMTDGKVLDTAAPGQVLPAEIAALVKATGKAVSKPSASLLRIDGRLAMVALCRIAPSSDGRTADPARGRTLVFVDVLDQAVLGEMSRIYLLDGLKSVTTHKAPAAHVVLKDRDGQAIGAIGWDQPQPGRTMLLSIAPVAAVLALIVALAGSWLMRNVRRIVERMLEDRAKAEDAIVRARLALAAAKAAQGDAAEARRQLEELELAHRQLEELRQGDSKVVRLRA